MNSRLDLVEGDNGSLLKVNSAPSKLTASPSTRVVHTVMSLLVYHAHCRVPFRVLCTLFAPFSYGMHTVERVDDALSSGRAQILLLLLLYYSRAWS